MSDLCPVYAPFFGAMVSFHGRSGIFGRETPIDSFYAAGLHQCHRVYMYVFCIIVYPLHPGLTHIPGIGARQVSSLLESRVCRLQSPQLPYFNFATYDFTLQLWNRKVWCWHFSHVCITTGSHDEELGSRRHGWYHRCEWHYTRPTEKDDLSWAYKDLRPRRLGSHLRKSYVIP